MITAITAEAVHPQGAEMPSEPPTGAIAALHTARATPALETLRASTVGTAATMGKEGLTFDSRGLLTDPTALKSAADLM